MKLAVLTFVRNEERVSDTFYEFCIKAVEHFDVEMIVVSEGAYEQGMRFRLAKVIDVCQRRREMCRFAAV